MAEPEEPHQPPPTNTRKMKRKVERTYLILVMLTLVLVGGGLVGMIFGPEALVTAVPCLLIGALLILAPWLLLTLLEKWRERTQQ